MSIRPGTAEVTLSIGDLARRAGTKVETVRWYEREGLLPAPARTAGGHRAYTRAHLDRLAFVRHARELGFPLDDVRGLLRLSDDPERSCAEADRIARAHLDAVRGRIARLRALETELERMVTECCQGQVAECRVIEVLADHSHANCVDQHGHGWSSQAGDTAPRAQEPGVAARKSDSRADSTAGIMPGSALNCGPE